MSRTLSFRRIYLPFVTLAILSFAAPARAADPSGPRWYKGNTHTHTWWSDGDSPPETVVKWYKEHGYNFLTLSDHNIMANVEKWVPIEKGARLSAAEAYEKAYPKDWIVKRVRDGKTEYKLKTLAEFGPLFEKPGEFILIPGEELSDSFEQKPVHVNGINLKEVIKPPGGKSMLETMQNNIDAVLAQRKRTGQPMFPHLNHPNFHWANPVEDIMRLRGETLFEVHNGHPSVNNYGDKDHPAIERMWDIILTRRLTDLRLPVMYGLATDDAHGYTAWNSKTANPGRGWIMVRAPRLSPEALIAAIEQGDFYATTGVLLDEITFQDHELRIKIHDRPGVSYTTQFIGTLKDYQGAKDSAPADATGDRANPEIGKILSEQSGAHPSYRLTGKEIYVRAKIISTAKHPNPYKEGDPEVAWVQPVQPSPPRSQ